MTTDVSVPRARPCTGAILAGGRARRFGGRDKAALVIDGATVLDRQLRVLRAVPAFPLLVTDDRRRYAHHGVRVLEDALPGAGPLGGVHAALAAASTPQVIVLACDMPFVSAPLLVHLVSRAAGADAAVPACGGRLHPLCAVYAARLAAQFEALLGAGRRAMHDALDAIHVITVGEEELQAFGDPARLLANVNTPADLDAFGASAR